MLTPGCFSDSQSVDFSGLNPCLETLKNNNFHRLISEDDLRGGTFLMSYFTKEAPIRYPPRCVIHVTHNMAGIRISLAHNQ